MIKFNKKIALSLAIVTALGSLTGCSLPFGHKEEASEQTYELTAVTADELVQGKIYVKDGDKFYECPLGKTTYNAEEKPFVEEADETRVIMFGKDDALIPTLYKDQQLVYVTNVNPTQVFWERYEDEGYSIGVCGLQQSDAGKFAVKIDGTYFQPDSSLKKAVAESDSLNPDDEIIFNKISTVNIDSPNVSRAGSILGLKQDQAYSVDIYKGSDYYPLTNVLADTHIFCNFEVQSSKSFDYIEKDYIVINVPDSIMTGYYSLNGLGFFRYVDGAASDGVKKGTDFNIPYFYTDEETGDVLTYDQINGDKDKTSTKDDKDDKDSEKEKADLTNTIYVDCSNKKMTSTVNYGNITAVVDGNETDVVNETTDFPTAVLTAPNGKTYDFLLDQEKSSLACVVDNPMSGEWTVSVYNTNNRRISFVTEFVSGHSDTLFHEGDGAQDMTYYLKDHMSDGLLAITWDNKSRAAKITITTPDGTKFSQEETPENVYAEGYGYVEFKLGELNYGDYKITLEGSDLGRVRVQSEDLALTPNNAPTIQVEDSNK